MWALIENSTVVELTDIDPEGRFPPALVWISTAGLDPQPQPGWIYESGIFSPYVPPAPSDEALAGAARLERENLMRSVCDPGILMAQRTLRMAQTPEEIAYAEGKIIELDAYAFALQNIPDQPGFPQTIIWPVAPTK